MDPQSHLPLDPVKPDDRLLRELMRVSDQVAAVARDVASLKQQIARQRREISGGTLRHHVATLGALGGRCPCCGSRSVLGEDGRKAEGTEFDHFYSASKPDAEHIWPVRRPCHSDLTAGRIARSEREAEFLAYQDRRRRMVERPRRLL